MWPVATRFVHSVIYVSLYVCVLGVRMRPTKMVEPVEILFRGCVGPRNHRWGCTLAPPAGRDWMSHVWQWCSLLSDRPMWAQERCRISPPHFMAECCMRQLNQGNFVLLYFRLFTFSDLYWVFVFSCTVFTQLTKSLFILCRFVTTVKISVIITLGTFWGVN